MNRNNVFELSIEQKERIYETYFTTVYKLALYFTKNKLLAEDVTQEMFLKAFEKYYQLKNQQKLENWIKAITVNTARKYLIDKQRVTLLEPYIIEQNVLHSTLDLDHSVRLDLKEILPSLPPEFLEVLILRFYSDLEINEIARLLNIPEGTVKSRLFRARERLKILLGNTYLGIEGRETK